MKDKLLYIAPSRSSFVRTDIESLSTVFEVHEITNSWSSGMKWFIDFTVHFIRVIRAMSGSKAVIVSFAGYWSLVPSFLSKLLGIPCFIVLNGTDVASISSIGYGSLRIPTLRWAIHKSLKYCDLMLPVSQSLIKCTNTFDPRIISAEQEQGVKVFFPKLKTGFKVIPNGIDTDFWVQDESCRKENTFIAVFSKNQFFLKGGDLICETANQLPESTFYVAGTSERDIPEEVHIPKNVFFLGALNRDELRMYYQKCSYVLQMSSFEGFGCALCEAMSCGCIPIVSNVNELPKIAGDSGIVLSKKDKALFKELLEGLRYQSTSKSSREEARYRVIENYSVHLRKNLLVELISKSK